jgi:hypothetical protein
MGFLGLLSCIFAGTGLGSWMLASISLLVPMRFSPLEFLVCGLTLFVLAILCAVAEMKV